MNIVKELEEVLKQPTFMGCCDKVGVNLAVNAILDKINELGFDIVEKENKKGESNMKEINIIIGCIDVRVGDKIFVQFDDRYDEDFAEWLDEYHEDLIVTEVDKENGMVWLKDCPYSVDMEIIINVER